MAGIRTEQIPPGGELTPEAVAALLARAARARREGNPAAARALLRALSAQQPELPQIWFALAMVAETRTEQRRALERVIALDPQNALARRGLARIDGARPTLAAAPTPPAAAADMAAEGAYAPHAAPAGDGDRRNGQSANQAAATVTKDALTMSSAPGASKAGLGAAPALAPAEPARPPPARAMRWPLYVVVVVSVLVVLIAALLLRGPELIALPRPAPTPALPGAAAEAPPIDATVAPAAASTAAPAGGALDTPASGAAALPAGAATVAPAISAPQPTAPPTPVPSPQPTPRQILAPGEVVTQGQWHVILIRPEDALALDGSIASFQPRGRFVLTLVAVGNDGQASARLPDNLFALVDSAGNRYAPLPTVSTAFLNSYGRGQYGDLSMEDLIPSDGGNKSVPLIFDVPASARALYLVVGDSTAGWPVGQ